MQKFHRRNPRSKPCLSQPAFGREYAVGDRVGNLIEHRTIPRPTASHVATKCF
ncbi:MULTISPECIES: hypothetical protein [unclassified Phenylobacterium]|jgi:hypothetical protein|uniref:hypothetical protein n=1 Tax=unclassified Phenylobacterium TaxID=2640670 RepID=UPI000A7AD712|nr:MULTISPECIES: hypothetical protein [unclassified Phenylobacterium]